MISKADLVNIVSLPSDKEMYSTIFNIASSALGGGILAYPFAFALSGLVGGLLLLSLVTLFSMIGNCAIVLSIDRLAPDATSYQGLMKTVIGREGEIAAFVSSFLFCFGTCLAYLIFIGNNLSPILSYFFSSPLSLSLPSSPINGIPSLPPHGGGMGGGVVGGRMVGMREEGGHEWFMNKKLVLIFYSFLLMLPLCCLKRMKELSYTCLVSIGCICYLSLTIFGLSFWGATDINGNPTFRIHLFSTDIIQEELTHVVLIGAGLKFLHAIPLMSFSFQSHVTTPPLYAELGNKTPERMYSAIFWATLLIAALYFTVGFFGYLTFGGDILLNSKTGSDILTMYSPTEAIIIGHICVTFIATFAFPMLHFVARLSLLDILQKVLDPPYSMVDDNKTYYSVTFIYFFICLGFALVVPSIEVVLALLGGTVVIALMLFLPGFLVLIQGMNSASCLKSAGAFLIGFLMIAFGLFVTSLSLTFFIDSFDS